MISWSFMDDSLNDMRDIFSCQYPNRPIPIKSTISNVIQNFKKGCVYVCVNRWSCCRERKIMFCAMVEEWIHFPKSQRKSILVGAVFTRYEKSMNFLWMLSSSTNLYRQRYRIIEFCALVDTFFFKHRIFIGIHFSVT